MVVPRIYAHHVAKFHILLDVSGHIPIFVMARIIALPLPNLARSVTISDILANFCLGLHDTVFGTP
jgi:hypothetical protein